MHTDFRRCNFGGGGVPENHKSLLQREGSFGYNNIGLVKQELRGAERRTEKGRGPEGDIRGKGRGGLKIGKDGRENQRKKNLESGGLRGGGDKEKKTP